MKIIELALVVFDASTQARAAIDETVVAQYAEQMLNGAKFPPVDLFHDGSRFYMGDGFHRGLAAQRNGATTLPATVHVGTREDALWFALGANKAHGHQMTKADMRHAVQAAHQTWPDKRQADIASQVGCSQGFVSLVISSNKRHEHGPKYRVSPEKVSAIETMLRDGRPVGEITKTLKTGIHTVSKIREDKGIAPKFDRSREAIDGRRDTMRKMAAEGHTSRQIAAAIGLSEEGTRNTLRVEGIDVPADRTTHHMKRHDSNRIVEHMASDAENLTADVNLIVFGELDPVRLVDWIDGFVASRKSLDSFIKRLIQEHKKHGEAA